MNNHDLIGVDYYVNNKSYRQYFKGTATRPTLIKKKIGKSKPAYRFTAKY